ncbi:hypothetical protein AFK69_17860, partial [Xenorhabdus sp. GDc328]
MFDNQTQLIATQKTTYRESGYGRSRWFDSPVLTNRRFFFYVMSALAEMERELIIERTNAGLAAARAQGRIGGRPIALPTEKYQY